MVVVPLISVVAVLVTLAVRGWTGGSTTLSDPRAAALVAPNTVVSQSPEIENTYGIRVTQVGVSAAGGMVDLRYVVLDPLKAHRVGSSKSDSTVLIVERNGRQLVTSGVVMHHRTNVLRGQGMFILFRNDYGTVRPGDYVTLVVGKAELRHLMAH
jgi:propanediol utilization protein